MLREMVQADVDAVLNIELCIQRYPWTRGNFHDAVSSGYVCLVDERNDEICSYAILMPTVEEAELLAIGVAMEQQRKGLGKAMLDEMLARASKQNMKRVFLEVRVTNLAAVALYRYAGFAEVGMRRNYYKDEQGHEDALVMACQLTDADNG